MFAVPVLVAVTAGMPTAAGAAGPVSAHAQAVAREASGGTVVDRTLRDSRVAESSGLVVARRDPSVLWTHNDSGNSPLLYAIDRNGSTVATARVGGVANVDWEALAPLTARDGSPLLAIGDLGDNNHVRSGVEIDVVPEPSSAGSGRVTPVRVIHLRYPQGAADAEALLADPRDGRLYVVTKGLFSSTIYAVPAQAWPGTAGTGRSVSAILHPVGKVSLTLVTDGAVLPDGRVLLRTYGSLALLAPLATPADPYGTPASLEPLATMSLPAQRQGEGLAVADAAAGTLLLSSEGIGESVLRLSVPVNVWQAGGGATAAAAAAGAASSGMSSGPTRKGTGAAGGAGAAGGMGAAGGAGAAGGMGAAGGAGAAGGMGAAGGAVAGAAGDAGTSGGTPAWVFTLVGAAAFGALLAVGRLAARRRPRGW